LKSVEIEESGFFANSWQRIKNLFGGGEDSTFIMSMLIPVGIVFTLGILFPLIYGLIITFFYLDVSQPQYREVSFSTFVNVGNYLAMITESPPYRGFWRYYLNTVIFTVVTVFFELVLGLIVALLLNKQFKGRGIVRAAVLVPWAMPTIVNAKIWQLLFLPNEQGAINDVLLRLGTIDELVAFEGMGRMMPVNLLWSISLFLFPVLLGVILYTWIPKAYKFVRTDNFGVREFFDSRSETIVLVLVIFTGIILLLPQSMFLPGGALATVLTIGDIQVGFTFPFPPDFFVVFIVDIWKTTPFMALLILASLQTIPQDLYKAAEVDGASKWQQFREITYPMIFTGIMIALIFRCIDAFRVYDILAVFTADSIASITKLAINKHSDGIYSAAATIAIFEFLNIIVFVVFFMWLIQRRSKL